MSPEPGPLLASGDRVRVATVREQDIVPYRRAVEQSRHRLARWNPVDPDDLARALLLQARDRRTFLIHALSVQGDHDIVGKVNVSDVVRGRFQSAAMGYDAYDPYAGHGLFADGLRLVLNLLFTPGEAGGLGLHRVAAAVQPGNVRSAGLLRSLGFRREGFSPSMLWLPGADGRNAWQGHDSYVMLADQWPAAPYPASGGPEVVVLVNGLPGSGSTTLARQLAAELRVPLFSQDVVASDSALWALLADSPVGGVVEGCFWPDDVRSVSEGLLRGGLQAAAVPEVWCHPASAEVSAEAEAQGLGRDMATGRAPTRPLGLGPTLAVDTRRGVGRADVVRLALQLRAGRSPAFET